MKVSSRFNLVKIATFLLIYAILVSSSRWIARADSVFISEVSPNAVPNNIDTTLTIRGGGFQNGAQVIMDTHTCARPEAQSRSRRNPIPPNPWTGESSSLLPSTTACTCLRFASLIDFTDQVFCYQADGGGRPGGAKPAPCRAANQTL